MKVRSLLLSVFVLVAACGNKSDSKGSGGDSLFGLAFRVLGWKERKK
jgi:hypothetical protein